MASPDTMPSCEIYGIDFDLTARISFNYVDRPTTGDSVRHGAKF